MYTLEALEQGFLIATSIISLLGCTLIFTTWESSTLPNYLSRRIVASMGFAGMMTAFAFCLSIFVNGIGENYVKQEALCYLQAFLLQYFYLASYLWTSCFAWHLYQIIVIRNQYPEQLLWKYRVIGWGIPGIFLIYLVLRQLTGHLGVGGADRRWCWIAIHTANHKTDMWQREGAWQQFVFFYFPIGGVLVFNSIIYRLLLRFLVMDPMASRLKFRVASYLSIFVFCTLWGVLNRIVQFTQKDHTRSQFLTILEGIGDPLLPLLNAIVYGTNKSSMDAYKARLCCWMSWYTRSTLSTTSDDEESGLDNASLLSNDGENEEDDDDERVYGGIGDARQNASKYDFEYRELPEDNVFRSGRHNSNISESSG